MNKQKKKVEFSKIICIVAFAIFLCLGIWIIGKYYGLVELCIQNGLSVLPDAALPIASITFILAPIISYLAYQGGLKKSRNKYGVDPDGQPYCRKDGDDA